MKVSRVIAIALVAFVTLAFVGQAAAADKVKVGYLHTLAVDGQMWIAMEKGYFKQQGLEIEPIAFTSGIPLMQALSGGSVDVAIMGAVIANFPSRGVGKVFLLNNIEYDTAMLFARPETGAKSIKDVKGQKIATVKGTTAHVFLHTALKQNGLDSTKCISAKSCTAGSRRCRRASAAASALPRRSCTIPTFSFSTSRPTASTRTRSIRCAS